ncbi:MAG: hypothetical protein ABIQ89_02075 [Candidatus Saccharimonadales bacterium]
MAEITLPPPIALLQKEATETGEHLPVKASPLLFRDVRRIREGVSEAIFTLSNDNNTGDFYPVRKHFKEVSNNLANIPEGMSASLRKITVLRKCVNPGEPFGSERTGAWHTDKPDNIDLEVLIGQEQPTGFIYGTDNIPDEYAESRTKTEQYLNSFGTIEELLDKHNFAYLQAMPYQAMQTDEAVFHIAPKNLRPVPTARDIIVAGYSLV